MSDVPAAPEACPIPRRARWRRRDTIEAVAIVLALAVAALATGELWTSLPLGRALATAGAVILAQGLVRDAVRLATRDPSAPRQRLRCLCAESAVGPVLVVGGILLLLAGIDAPVGLDRPRVVGALAVLLTFGFVAKDWVIVLKRVEDHGGIDL
jgi:hypothetical protein